VIPTVSTYGFSPSQGIPTTSYTYRLIPKQFDTGLFSCWDDCTIRLVEVTLAFRVLSTITRQSTDLHKLGSNVHEYTGYESTENLVGSRIPEPEISATGEKLILGN